MTPLLALIALAQASHVRLVTDEAESVLAILATEQTGNAPGDADWSSLFATDGYRRLKAREKGMGRKFEDDDFKKFVQSPALVTQRVELQKTLLEWEKADVRECQQRALAYLPKGADITAKVYLLIKPLHNSFVWETDKDPAIMLYLDPTESHDAFAGTVAHEMHHIGYSRSCPSADFDKWLESKPRATKTAYMWLGAFGEGFAVLAAASGLNNDPQVWARDDVRKAWADGMAHQSEQFTQIESYFLEVLNGDLDATKAQDKAMTFFGLVGPWYTVGYTVATTIEKVDGREKLIACYRDPRLILSTYNAAAQKLGGNLPLWSKRLLDAMR